MTITYVSVKGGPLNVAEHDGNISDLDGRLTTVETNPPDANGIANVTQPSQSQIRITLDDSTQYTFTLPTAVFAWRGEWAATTSYFTNDVVFVEDDGVYIVLQNHTSDSTFDADASDSDGNFYAQLFGVVTGTPYDFTLVLDATPAAGATIDRVPILRDITIPANFDGAVASGGTNPDDFSDFTGYEISVRDDDVEIGTVTIDGAGAATWATTSGTLKDVDAGSILTIVAPDDGSDQDGSIADWIFGIKATVS